MKERPILFSAPMVRAILAGRKTQTRRVVEGSANLAEPTTTEWALRQKARGGFVFDCLDTKGERYVGTASGMLMQCAATCPYGVPGDRLWVRETFFVNDMSCVRGPLPKTKPAPNDPTDPTGAHLVLWRADGEFADHFEQVDGDAPWRPSIHMPRWASRITLDVTDVRVERLKDMPDGDVEKEGVKILSPAFPRSDFMVLWDSINGNREGCLWMDNPWVWVVSFKRIEKAEAA